MNDSQMCMLVPLIIVLLVFGGLFIYEWIQSYKFSKELKHDLRIYEEIRKLLQEWKKEIDQNKKL